MVNAFADGESLAFGLRQSTTQPLWYLRGRYGHRGVVRDLNRRPGGRDGFRRVGRLLVVARVAREIDNLGLGLFSLLGFFD